MHHRRHRTIAKLVKELEAHDRQVATRATRTKIKGAKATQETLHGQYIRHRGVSKTGDEDVENEEPAGSTNNEDPDDDDAYSNQTHHEETAPFITIPNSHVHMTAPSTPKPGSSISSIGYDSSPANSSKKKDLKKARRTARLTNNNAQSIVSNGFLNFIAEALHGSKITDISSAMFEEEGEEIGANQFKNEDLMRENLGFQTFTRNFLQVRHIKDRWRKLGPRGKAQELAAPCPIAPGSQKPKFVNISESTRFDINFFARLGVKYENKGDTSKTRSEIVLKLVNQILEDMDIIAREEYETQVREAGFWRFVNRAAAQNLQEAHEDFSWATGEYRKRRRPGMLSEGTAETELGNNAAVVGSGLGAGDEPGQEARDNENDFSDDECVPGTPSLVASAFETQAEEEKKTPQMKTPFILKFTNFDRGRKDVVWTPTPSKVISSPKVLSSAEPETISSPKVRSAPQVISSPKTSFPQKAPSTPKTPFSPKVATTPKVPSTPNALLLPKVPSSPKTLFSPTPTVWSSLKQNQLKPTKPVVNQKRHGPMNSFRLVKIEKKHVAVPLTHKSNYKLCRDQPREGATALTSEFAMLEVTKDNYQDDDDMWEVVRPSLPNVRAKNPYDLLSTVEEGSGKDDSSSEEGSGPN